MTLTHTHIHTRKYRPYGIFFAAPILISLEEKKSADINAQSVFVILSRKY